MNIRRLIFFSFVYFEETNIKNFLINQVYQVTSKIKNMAEQAQANLGMDYAWLEDVSYLDWQRYHDLMRG